jgi:integrase
VTRKVLTLVQPKSMYKSGYSLPDAWDLALNGWLLWLKLGGVSVNTMRLRREHVRPIARRSKTRHPRELTLAILEELCDEPWSNEYRRGVRTSLISFCEWCRAHELMDSNPAIHLPAVPGDKPKPRPAPDEVWIDLLESARPRERMMARLAGEAGLRRGEIARTRRSDLIHDVTGWALIVLGKGNKQRVVPITEDLAGAIRGFCEHGYLFPGETNGHLSPGWVGQSISDLMPPGWTIHKLRHRYASRGYAGTRDIFAVKEALGHQSVATTQMYVAITRDDVRRVSEAAGYPNGVA